MVRLKVQEFLYFPMDHFIKEILMTIKLRVMMANIILQNLSIKEVSGIMFFMAKERKKVNIILSKDSILMV